MTLQEFIERVGREPIGDEIERVNCQESGTAGHWFCGWCHDCDKPRFECGHRTNDLRTARAEGQ